MYCVLKSFIFNKEETIEKMKYRVDINLNCIVKKINTVFYSLKNTKVRFLLAPYYDI